MTGSTLGDAADASSLRAHSGFSYPAALGLFVIASAPAAAQRFNCRYAHYADERAICRDPALGRLDDELSFVFNDTTRRLPAQEHRKIEQDETAWVIQRRQCGANPDCVAQAYRSRMTRLASAPGSSRPSGARFAARIC